MFLDIVGVITTSKLSILSTFQGGAVSAPPPCQVGLIQQESFSIHFRSISRMKIGILVTKHFCTLVSNLKDESTEFISVSEIVW